MNTGKIWDLVGQTPLIKIQSLSKLTGCKIWGKAEFMNPGGSVKDRAAKFIIAAAEKSGELKPGYTIVEGTAGNTGIGIATLAAERGYKVILTMPDNQSDEKYQLLEALGVEIQKGPPVPFTNEQHFYHRARVLSENLKNSFWANQFENPANARAHFDETGPEIWQQTDQNVDIFTCAIGTGGTMSGVSQFFKEINPTVRIVAADPFGSGILSHLKTQKLEATGSSITEGIGIMRLTANYLAAKIDDGIRVSDQDMINMLYHLAKFDGLVLGTSAALNCFAAYQLGMQNKNSGKSIVTILCDHGMRYQSRIFNKDWLSEKGLNPTSL